MPAAAAAAGAAAAAAAAQWAHRGAPAAVRRRLQRRASQVPPALQPPPCQHPRLPLLPPLGLPCQPSQHCCAAGTASSAHPRGTLPLRGGTARRQTGACARWAGAPAPSPACCRAPQTRRRCAGAKRRSRRAHSGGAGRVGMERGPRGSRGRPAPAGAVQPAVSARPPSRCTPWCVAPSLPLHPTAPPPPTRRAPPPTHRMCSSASVSPKRSGGAATVPRSSSCSLDRKDSRNTRPFSCRIGGGAAASGAGRGRAPPAASRAARADPPACHAARADPLLPPAASSPGLRWRSTRRTQLLRPLRALSFSGCRSCSSTCVSSRRRLALRYSFSSTGTMVGTFSR